MQGRRQKLEIYAESSELAERVVWQFAVLVNFSLDEIKSDNRFAG